MNSMLETMAETSSEQALTGLDKLMNDEFWPLLCISGLIPVALLEGMAVLGIGLLAIHVILTLLHRLGTNGRAALIVVLWGSFYSAAHWHLPPLN